jgi:hypothetical protein
MRTLFADRGCTFGALLLARWADARLLGRSGRPAPPDCVGGGTPVSLTRATALYGANWERDGTIVYGQQDGIWRVSANGGERQQIVRIEANELVYGPRMLPDGRRVLFSLVKRDGMVGQPTAWDTARVVVQTLQTGERREIAVGSGNSGHLFPEILATSSS